MDTLSRDVRHVEGLFEVMVDGSWRNKWVTLKAEEITISRSEFSPKQRVIQFKAITKLERTDLKPCCLLIEAGSKQYCISFSTDKDLYAWQDLIYGQTPLGSSVSGPFDFSHNVHAHFDSERGLQGIPPDWEQALLRGLSASPVANDPAVATASPA